MKIIDIGICVDNVDPKGIGRIRCVRYSDFVSVKERSMSYEKFDDRDSFVAIPFLPLNINYIPEIGQAVKILTYNAEKDNVNVEYIAGPFTTPHDFNGQVFSSQISNTTYGVVFKEATGIINPKLDTFINPESNGALAKKTDYGIYGKYGSDVIFTENGLQLRGGKLVTKQTKSKEKRKKLISEPLMSNTSSTLYLKKFPQTFKLVKRVEKETIVENRDLSLIIEYEFTTTSPYVIDFFVYDVIKGDGTILNTNNFNDTTIIPSSSVKLINIENDDESPTYTVTVNNENDVVAEIRDFLFTIHESGLQVISPLYKNERKNRENRHPMFFRPRLSFIATKLDSNQNTLRDNIFNQIQLYSTLLPTSDLIWSLENYKPPVKIREKIIDDVSVESDIEQSFSAIKSDKILLLSTDPNKTNRSVDFSKLDKYELTQEDYVKNIIPKTFSTVRGENLVALIRAMIDVIYTHRHNLNEPMVKSDQYVDYVKLNELLKNLENDILNNSIRIN
jgi:hypothetical protein